MRIGFSERDITPAPGVTLCGQPFVVTSVGVRDNLYAKALCLHDGNTSVLIVSCDILLIPNAICVSTREAVQCATGIPAENVILCATHTHSAPSTEPILGAEADEGYIVFLQNQIVAAAKEAQKALSKGDLHAVSDRIHSLAFNRRYLMSDGSVETHPLKGDPHSLGPEGPDSTALGLIYAVDPEGDLMGAAVSFGCHATVMERRNDEISADYPGRISKYVNEKLGAKTPVLFLQGAAGNICQVDPRNLQNYEVGSDWVSKMGDTIGQNVVDLTNGEHEIANGPLRILTKVVYISRRAAAPELVVWAENHTPFNAGLPELSNYGAELYGQTNGVCVSLEELFKTPYWADFYAAEILRLERAREHEPEMPITVTVIAQHNWSIVALPCELFVEWGERIYEESPFEATIVVTLANGWCGYVPTAKAFERVGGYETKEVTSTMLVPEAGNILVNTVLEILRQVAQQE